MAAVSRTPSTRSLEEPPEYRAMRESHVIMVDVFKHSIDSLGDALFAKQLIPLDVKDNLRTMISQATKTREVIDCVTGRVKYKPQAFHDFIMVLKEQGWWTEPAVEHLLSCYETQAMIPQPPSTSSSPRHDSQSTPRIELTVPQEVPSEVGIIQISVLYEDENQSRRSLIELPLTTPATTDSQASSLVYERTKSTSGRRDVLLVVSKVDPAQHPNVVPRRNRGPLTEEDKHKLQEQGIHEDCCYNDLTITMARYVLQRECTITGVLAAEQRTCTEARHQVKEFFNTTDKEGVVLYYNGPGERETGNWCFKDGFISFDEIVELYNQYLRPKGCVLTIVSDCSYSGRWVKEAMAFMDRKGVGPCGHAAKEKGILIKVLASCLTDEVPAELAFSTHTAENKKNTGIVKYTIDFRGEEIYDSQHPSGLDFTQVRCTNKINQPCTMAPSSTWQQWSDGHGIRIVRGQDKGRPIWHCILLADNEETMNTFEHNLDKGVIELNNYGRILERGYGKDPPDETLELIKKLYLVNYNYHPSSPARLQTDH